MLLAALIRPSLGISHQYDGYANNFMVNLPGGVQASLFNQDTPCTPPGGLNQHHHLNLRPLNLRLLVTTNIELKAIAPAAIIGLRYPRAAAGISKIL